MTNVDKGRGPRGGIAVPFPMQLFIILGKAEQEGFAHIISWQPQGRSFIVHDPKAFVADIMPRYFCQTKFSSFQRQLNMYGFSRVKSGNNKGAYYHEKFSKNDQSSCERILRIAPKEIAKTKKKGGTKKAESHLIKSNSNVTGSSNQTVSVPIGPAPVLSCAGNGLINNPGGNDCLCSMNAAAAATSGSDFPMVPPITGNQGRAFGTHSPNNHANSLGHATSEPPSDLIFAQNTPFCPSNNQGNEMPVNFNNCVNSLIPQNSFPRNAPNMSNGRPQLSGQNNNCFQFAGPSAKMNGFTNGSAKELVLNQEQVPSSNLNAFSAITNAMNSFGSNQGMLSPAQEISTHQNYGDDLQFNALEISRTTPVPVGSNAIGQNDQADYFTNSDALSCGTIDIGDWECWDSSHIDTDFDFDDF